MGLNKQKVVIDVSNEEVEGTVIVFEYDDIVKITGEVLEVTTRKKAYQNYDVIKETWLN